MSSPASRQARRAFLKRAAIAAVVLPVGARTLFQTARAQDLPHLDPSDPTAQALGYTHDASTVDTSKYPQFAQGHVCSNCNFIQGEDGAQWRPCQLFPGKAVNADGWCISWVAKPA